MSLLPTVIEGITYTNYKAVSIAPQQNRDC